MNDCQCFSGGLEMNDCQCFNRVLEMKDCHCFRGVLWTTVSVSVECFG